MTGLPPPPPPDFSTDRLPRIVSRQGLINIELFNELQTDCETRGLPDPDFRQVARAGASAVALVAFIRDGALRAALQNRIRFRGQLRRCRSRYAAGRWESETQRRFLALLFPEVVPRRPEAPDRPPPCRQRSK